MKVLLSALFLTVILSCNTNSKPPTKVHTTERNTVEVNTVIAEDSIDAPLPDTMVAPETINFADTIIKDSIPPLSNDRIIPFLKRYGKDNPETKVKISTDFGDIIIELYRQTPLHRANFIHLVKRGYFDQTFFYRVAKDFVIQGGNSDRYEMSQVRARIGEYTLPQEFFSNLTHRRGAVALSKHWVDNPSNRSTPFEFFIVIAKNGANHLNGEHTIFGRVIKGMDVADKIGEVQVDGSEWPKEDIRITATVLP